MKYLFRRKAIEAAIAFRRRASSLRFLAKLARWYIRSYDNFNYDSETNGERWLVQQVVGPDSVVFDVGANIGEWTSMVRRWQATAEVHAFEIVPATAAILRRHSSPLVQVNQFGLLDREGFVTVRHRPGFSEGSSIFPDLHNDVPEEVTCPVMTGDVYCMEHGVERIRLLKIDVEGSEHLVLAGFAGMLERGGVDVVQFEYGMASIASRFLLQDYFKLLDAAGFVIGKLYPGYVDFQRYRLEQEDFRGPNFVAVRTDRSDLLDRLEA